MTWAAVVVNYNAGNALLDCVKSALEAEGLAELVVVDNSSSDGSVEALARAHPEVRVVHSGGNLGYARAANLGIAATEAAIVAVLNPDTVMHPGTTGVVVERFSGEADLGALGPRLLNTDGTVYPSARNVPNVVDAAGHGVFFLAWPENPFTRRYRQIGADPSAPRDVDWVSGAAVWLRRAALDDVGGWDERFFMYVEDVELCWRLRRGGWRVAYEPEVVVEHLLGVSTAGVPYRMIAEHHRSLLRFAARRFIGPRQLLLPPAAAFLSLRALLAMAHHKVVGKSLGTGRGRLGTTGSK
jgi:GT2 family glycosyltransferase